MQSCDRMSLYCSSISLHVFTKSYGVTMTSPQSATLMELYGCAPVSVLQARTRTDSLRICRGPNLVPLRFEVPQSMGTPTKQASKPETFDKNPPKIPETLPTQRECCASLPAAVCCIGRRNIELIPHMRGISFPEGDWLKVRDVRDADDVEIHLRSEFCSI